MKFIRNKINSKKYIDNVFSVSSKAKNDPSGINASLGCLFDEEKKIYIFDSIYKNEKNVSSKINASYANPIGNNDYLRTIKDYILNNHVKNNNQIIATSGGTGAIHIGIRTCLDEGDSIVLPNIGWGNYSVMADEMNLNIINYDIYNINSLLNIIDEAKGKVFIIINSPCHNPCGHSYSYDEWKTLINKMNTCDKEVIILNDIAYIDYADEECKKYFDLFNNINDNVLILIAHSCSKAFSYYGKRVGALIAINNDMNFLDTYINYCTRVARTTWSNVNNGAMQNIADVLTNHREEYELEKKKAVNMLQERANLFLKQADTCGLEYYPYTNGFFITLKFNDLNKRDNVFDKLVANHIYTVKVNKGLRIGICSLSFNEIDGLANKIKSLL